MALTKANSDVVDIPNITVSLQTDTTSGGLGISKANLASPIFTGTPTLVTSPSITTDINTTRVADNTFYNNLSQNLNISGGTNIDFYPHGYTMDEDHDAFLSSVQVHYVTEESYYVIVNTYFQEGIISYTTRGGFTNTDYDTRHTYSTCYSMSSTGLITQTRLPHNPCNAATTANITLNGSQTIDGVSVNPGMRVLVKNQTTASENGIYVVAAGAWTRATDADTAGELPTGSHVYIQSGTVNSGISFTLTSGTIGSSITFNNIGSVEQIFAPISVSITTEKTSCRVATTAAGTLATSFANGQTIDGITLATGNRILIKNQATASENGIYTVNATGAPTRATDADTAGELPTGSHVYIEDGSTNVGTTWTLTSGTIGSNMVFENHSGNGANHSASITIGSTTFLAIAYQRNSNGVANSGTFASNTYVYSWNATLKKFTNIVNIIPTNGAEYVEFFQIGTDYFLAICNHILGSSYAQSVKIYKWDGTTRFGNAQINPSVHQTISANGPVATRKFQIGSDHYLAVANQRDSSSDVATNSFVYKWNTGTSLFDTGSPTFTLATTYATDVDFFQIGTDYFLTFACYSSSSTPQTITSGIPDGITNSFVCKWNGSTFTTLQTIKTMLCMSLRYFHDGSGTSHYLIASQNYDLENYTTDADGPNDFVLSKVYSWNQTLGRFSEASLTIGLESPQKITFVSTSNYGAETDYLLCVPQTSASAMNVSSPVYNFSKYNLLNITRKD